MTSGSARRWSHQVVFEMTLATSLRSSLAPRARAPSPERVVGCPRARPGSPPPAPPPPRSRSAAPLASLLPMTTRPLDVSSGPLAPPSRLSRSARSPRDANARAPLARFRVAPPRPRPAPRAPRARAPRERAPAPPRPPPRSNARAMALETRGGVRARLLRRARPRRPVPHPLRARRGAAEAPHRPAKDARDRDRRPGRGGQGAGSVEARSPEEDGRRRRREGRGGFRRREGRGGFRRGEGGGFFVRFSFGRLGRARRRRRR